MVTVPPVSVTVLAVGMLSRLAPVNSKAGPSAAIVNAHRFIFDSRDQAAVERLKILNDQFGVYRCHTIFNCTDACPREIQVTQAVGEVKKAIATARLD